MANTATGNIYLNKLGGGQAPWAGGDVNVNALGIEASIFLVGKYLDLDAMHSAAVGVDAVHIDAVGIDATHIDAVAVSVVK